MQLAAKAVETADRQQRRAFVDLCIKVFDFQQTHDEKDIKAWLDQKGLKVTAKANGWTAVVKLAFASKEANGTWTVSNQQVNKYANVMQYAEKAGIESTKIEEWIGKRTLTELVEDARTVLQENGSSGSKQQEKIEQHLKDLRSKWQPTFAKGLPKQVDPSQFPYQGNPVQILADIDEKGNLKPFSILQADGSKLLNLITPSKSLTPTADDVSQSLAGVVKLFAFADLLPMNLSVQRSVILDIKDDEWRMYVCEPNRWSCPVAVARFGQKHQQLPVGKWFLDSAKQKALSFLLQNFPDDMIDISTSGDYCLIALKDGEDKTLNEYVSEIDEKKKRDWRIKKDKQQTKLENPPEFELPKEIKDNNNTLKLPDASAMDVARLRKNVTWTDTELCVSRNFRKQVAHFCDKEAKQKFYKVRFGVRQTSFFYSHANDALKTIQHDRSAKKELALLFSINKTIIGNAMHALDFVLEAGSCALHASENNTVIRFTGQHNGGEYDIYIPKIGMGDEYEGDEFSKGPWHEEAEEILCPATARVNICLCSWRQR